MRSEFSQEKLKIENLTCINSFIPDYIQVLQCGKVHYTYSVRLLCCLLSIKQRTQNCIKLPEMSDLHIPSLLPSGPDTDRAVNANFFCQTHWDNLGSQNVLSRRERSISGAGDFIIVTNEFVFSVPQVGSALYRCAEAKTLTLEKMKVVNSQLVFHPRGKACVDLNHLRICPYLPSFRAGISEITQGSCISARPVYLTYIHSFKNSRP